MSKKKNRKPKGKTRTIQIASRSNGTRAKSKDVDPPTPPNLVQRVWLAAIALVLVQGAVWGAREFAFQATTRDLNRPFAELPLELGAYTGVDREQDPELFKALGALSTISRIYTRADGTAISVHLAAWDESDGWTPHSPDICYPSSGWSEQNRKRVELPTTPPVQSAVREFVADGRHVKVLFWYRLGEGTYTDASEARAARQRMIGQREWPPVVKVMLQTNVGGESERVLRDFAVHVDEFTREL